MMNLPEKFKLEASLIAASEFNNVRYEVILRRTPPKALDSLFIDFDCYSTQKESTPGQIYDLSFITRYDFLTMELNIVIHSGFLLRRTFSNYVWLDDDYEPVDFSSPVSKQFEKISANLLELFQDYFFTPHNLYLGL